MSPDATTPVWTRAAIAGCFVWFGARLVWMAVSVGGSVPPDEVTHVGRVLAHAATWGLPHSGPDNYTLGLISDRPFLYGWVLGRLAALGLDSLLWLRLVNVAMALATAGYGLRFIRVVTQEPLTHVVFLVCLTNTLMFTGIGAAVSYDNGANLLAAAAFYYLAELRSNWDPKTLAALLLATGLGCLTKRSFLPLAALIIAAVLFHERRHLKDARARLAGIGRPLSVGIAVVALANMLLYGSNLAHYQKLVPSFDQVVGLEAARQNRIFARDFILDGYREGRIEFARALQLTTTIDHAGDRRSTRNLLEISRRHGERRVAWFMYPIHWSSIMFDRSLGYFGHGDLYRQPWERVAFGLVLALALVFHARGRRGSQSPLAGEFGGIALAYGLVLLALVNYPTYAEKGLIDAGVQGRYLFPVWVPLMGWLACALAEGAPRSLRLPVAAAVCALFVYSDGPTFWLRTSSAWFG
ncbi:MAG: glycosyltransferase family 39 protein [Myxococcota bacterium]|nr:glycosyltransferase family 39 protein [Myxococcota bacterium]